MRMMRQDQLQHLDTTVTTWTAERLHQLLSVQIARQGANTTLSPC